ncbi:MAG: hypothetical protein R3D03_14400 [Geminicoccaceae bacterium]
MDIDAAAIVIEMMIVTNAMFFARRNCRIRRAVDHHAIMLPSAFELRVAWRRPAKPVPSWPVAM